MMNKQPFFSIILPAYNASTFLSNTLRNILSQQYSNFELLLINDGSTDSTADICTHYANMDKRISFISKHNEGVSVARNKGLDIAKGKYILFIDADDLLYPNALSTISDALKNIKTDYLRYEYQTIDEKGNPLYPNYEAKLRRKISNQILDAADCITHIVRNEYFLWSGIFRKEIIDQYHLRFMEGCTYNEDTLFMLQFFMHSKTHIYLPTTLYGYRKFEGAVTAKFTEKNYQDVKKVAKVACDIYTSCEDIRMQKAIKSVIEALYSRIIGTAYTRHEADSMIQFCCQHPIQYEWKMIKLLGYSIGSKCLPLMHFFQKIIRKFY
ncbi:glycosyltransferase [Phocaeicola plebeius]|uniref:glycosyltransferase n=1 Tax=Phocaeicola plebeius TaxID=310297 RepID=UPI00320A7CE9